MDLIYFGDGKRIGFNRESELGPGYKSQLVIDGIKYSSVDQFIGIFKEILFHDNSEVDYWQYGMDENSLRLIFPASLLFLDEVNTMCSHIEKPGWTANAWVFIRKHLMMKALRVKFKDHEMRSLLLSTKDKSLQFCDDHRFWGRRYDIDAGENALGKCLMKLRKELQN